MKAYQELTKEELLTLKAELNAAYEDAKGKGLKTCSKSAGYDNGFSGCCEFSERYEG